MNEVTNLLRLLQRVHEQQAREAMAKVRLGSDGVPDLSSWVEETAEACKPLLLALWQRGMVQAAARIAAGKDRMPRSQVPNLGGLRRHEPGNEAIFGPRKSAGTLLITPRKRIIRKAANNQIDFAFDLFNPRVLDAVDQAAYAFCRETMETATGELSEALTQLRQLMREGLSKGDAVELLARKVRQIFADPKRAFTIATTEGSRAQHAGQMMAAREAGIERHTWLASADACRKCLELDGKTVRVGQPFTVKEVGGPYAVVLHPPLHPHCFLHRN